MCKNCFEYQDIIADKERRIRALTAENAELKSLTALRSHQWTGCQRGGSPVDAGSVEWVRYCSVCGMEDTCEDPLPSCPGEIKIIAELRQSLARVEQERDEARKEASRAWGRNNSLEAILAMVGGVRKSIERERDEARQERDLARANNNILVDKIQRLQKYMRESTPHEHKHIPVDNFSLGGKTICIICGKEPDAHTRADL